MSQSAGAKLRQHTFCIFMAGGAWRTQGAHGNEVGLRRIHYHTLSVSVLGSLQQLLLKALLSSQ